MPACDTALVAIGRCRVPSAYSTWLCVSPCCWCCWCWCCWCWCWVPLGEGRCVAVTTRLPSPTGGSRVENNVRILATWSTTMRLSCFGLVHFPPASRDTCGGVLACWPWPCGHVAAATGVGQWPAGLGGSRVWGAPAQRQGRAADAHVGQEVIAAANTLVAHLCQEVLHAHELRSHLRHKHPPRGAQEDKVASPVSTPTPTHHRACHVVVSDVATASGRGGWRGHGHRQTGGRAQGQTMRRVQRWRPRITSEACMAGPVLPTLAFDLIIMAPPRSVSSTGTFARPGAAAPRLCCCWHHSQVRSSPRRFVAHTTGGRSHLRATRKQSAHARAQKASRRAAVSCRVCMCVWVWWWRWWCVGG